MAATQRDCELIADFAAKQIRLGFAQCRGDRDHVKLVAKQPCLVCGRRPYQSGEVAGRDSLAEPNVHFAMRRCRVDSRCAQDVEEHEIATVQTTSIDET